MKTAVVYSSKTGNTKKVAEAVVNGIASEVKLYSVEDKIHIEKYDFVFCGFWIDKGKPNTEAAEFMATLCNKKVALFATLGAYPDSQHAKDSLENSKNCLGDNCEVVDSFICQGAIAPKLIRWMSSLPTDHPHSPDKQRVKRWKDASSHPDKKDLDNAKEFAANVLRSIQ